MEGWVSSRVVDRMWTFALPVWITHFLAWFVAGVPYVLMDRFASAEWRAKYKLQPKAIVDKVFFPLTALSSHHLFCLLCFLFS